MIHRNARSSQIEADVLIERLTGQTHADAVPLTVNLVLSDRALLTNCDDETAHLDGYGPVPAEIARRIITTSTTPRQSAPSEDAATEAAQQAGDETDEPDATADTLARNETDDEHTVDTQAGPAADEPSLADRQAHSDTGDLVTNGGADHAPTDTRDHATSDPEVRPSRDTAEDTTADDLGVTDPLDAPLPDDFDPPVDTEIVPVWLRRIYANPATGALVAMESAARLFPEAMADYLRMRDEFCRTPYCDAPIRHNDHVQPHAEGGATSLDNGAGLCEACNHAKQADGWVTRTTHNGTGLHTIHLTTPAGITYLSTAPPAPGHDRRLSLVETHLAAKLEAA